MSTKKYTKSNKQSTTKKSTRTAKKSNGYPSRAKSHTSVKGKKCAPPNRFIGLLTTAIFGVAAVFLICALIIFAVFSVYQKTNSDAHRFAAEYTNVSEDNPFVYKSSQEIADIIKHGTGVVFLGFPECQWCQAYAGYLADVAKEVGLDTIYYHNIKDERANNTSEYQELVNLLSNNLQYDNEGQRYIYVPDAVFVIDGRIIANDLESSKDTANESDPANYWTESRLSALKARLKSYMQQIVSAKGCTDTCNK